MDKNISSAPVTAWLSRVAMNHTMFSQFFFPLHPRYVKVALSAATIVQKDVEALVANCLTGNR